MVDKLDYLDIVEHPDMTETPTRIAVAQQKGGVGKTTDTINFGGALAAMGHDVLLWDADPQGYLTMGVGMDNAYTADRPTQYSAMKEPGKHDVEDLIRTQPEFDVVPANIDMFHLEQELVSAMRGRQRLNDLLDNVTGYDFVLVDCPPSLGLLTDNALLACQNVVIPAEAEDTSIRAIEILFKQIDSLESNFDTEITEQAIIVSNIDYPLDGEQEGMLEWFDDSFGDYIPVYEFRNRAAVKRAYNAGVSIFESDEECDQEDSLLGLAQQFGDNQGELL
jgi:chromosome partitioning protein